MLLMPTAASLVGSFIRPAKTEFVNGAIIAIILVETAGIAIQQKTVAIFPVVGGSLF